MLVSAVVIAGEILQDVTVGAYNPSPRLSPTCMIVTLGGMDGYVAKPVGSSDLYAEIEAALEKSSQLVARGFGNRAGGRPD